MIRRTAGISVLVLLLPTVAEAQEPAPPETWEARRELLRWFPFQPAPAPDLPLHERTVFYDVPTPADELATVLILPRDEVEAVPRAVFQAAGWLVPEGGEVDRSGRIVGFEGRGEARSHRTTVHPYDRVRVGGGEAPAARVGDELLVFRLGQEVPGVGRVAIPTGRLRIEEVEEAGFLGTVVREYDRIRIGDLVTGVRTFPLSPGVHPAATDASLEARILALQHPRVMPAPGDFAFIDRGRDDGLAVGDELVGLAGPEEGWRARPVARFQVVGLRAGVGTVRLVSTSSPGAIRPGLGMVLDRTMP